MSKIYKSLYAVVLFVSAVYCDDCPPCKCKKYYGWTIDCTDVTVEFFEELTSVPRVNFSKAVEFEEITIRNHPLQNLTANEFQNVGLLFLQDIILHQCAINFVHEEAFNNLTNLNLLDLSYNNLSNLSDNVFKPIKRIRNILLNHNKIESINNKIFADLTVLEKLEISNNLLTTFNVNALLNNKILKQLHLSHNKLTSLNMNIIKTIQTLNILKIAGNPWICDCFIRDLFVFMKYKYENDKSNYRNEFTNTKCRAPNYLQSVSWRSIKEDNLKCWLNVTTISKRIETTIEKSITLLCLVDSNSLPNETWVHNNKTIDITNNKYHISRTIKDNVHYLFSLEIINLLEEDEGSYKCILTNNITQQMSEAEIMLIVEKEPVNLFFIFIIVGLIFFVLGCTVILIKCAIKCSINYNNKEDQPTFDDNFKLNEKSGRFSTFRKT